MPGPRKSTAVVLLAAAALAGAAPAAEAQDGLSPQLRSAMRSAGARSGAYVVNLTNGRRVFAWRSRTPRVLASNTKLFTTAAALARLGVDGTLGTEVRGSGELVDGVWRGDLYLRGGGDPTFGSRGFGRRSYGSGAAIEDLAARVEEAGIERVS